VICFRRLRAKGRTQSIYLVAPFRTFRKDFRRTKGSNFGCRGKFRLYVSIFHVVTLF